MPSELLFIEYPIAQYQNVLRPGATGCGKTAYIGSLIELTEPADRLITVEDTLEMPRYHHLNSNALSFRKSAKGVWGGRGGGGAFVHAPERPRA